MAENNGQRRLHLYRGDPLEDSHYLGLFVADFTPKIGYVYDIEVGDASFERHYVAGYRYEAGKETKVYVLPMGKPESQKIRRATIDASA